MVQLKFKNRETIYDDVFDPHSPTISQVQDSHSLELNDAVNHRRRDRNAESIKRLIAAQGNSSNALTFPDLYSKFSSKTASESIKNKWSMLYMLKVVSEDRKNHKVRYDSRISIGIFASTVSGRLSALFDSERNDNSKVSKDPEKIRDITYRKFVNLLKEENEMSEESMNPISLVSESESSGSYLSLRRLLACFAEAMVKMRLMALLADSCDCFVGCVILFLKMEKLGFGRGARRYFDEFFILVQPVKAEALLEGRIPSPC
ncbi:spindle pole body component 98 [Actinidia rufa]|uniref:Spindle pole body component 98 n=1 Tax=Actinidia rufa TaxID=165716 RepID=A0A7J0HDY5_9ERIC|nr:spindle pole body component 98 [Actinidia rufa]